MKVPDDEFDPDEARRAARLLVEKLGCDDALERTRRQERETELNPHLAKAIRMAVETICKDRGGRG